MTYIQLKKHDGGLEKKALRKQKRNLVWFPSHPTSMMWRVDCFPVSRVDQKQAGLSLWGRGSRLIGIKEQTWKGAAGK